MYETITAFLPEATFFDALVSGRSGVSRWFYRFSTAVVVEFNNNLLESLCNIAS